MIPSLWAYVSAGLGVVLFLMGIKILWLNGEVTDLTIDVADQEVLIEKLKSKSKIQKVAIESQKTTGTENRETINSLHLKLGSQTKSAVRIRQIHNMEIAKYKSIIEALEEDIVITSEVKDSRVKIMEIKDEGDYLGNSIRNIGF